MPGNEQKNTQLVVYVLVACMAITTLLDWRIDRRTEEQRTTRIALEKDLQTQFARKEVSVQEETQKKMRASIEGAFAPLPEDWWKPRRK